MVSQDHSTTVRDGREDAPTQTFVEQVAKQCDVVVHLATALAAVTKDRAELIRAGAGLNLANMLGERTAAQMEILGDILDGMDAVDEAEDAWTYPVFAAAQALFGDGASSRPLAEGDAVPGITP